MLRASPRRCSWRSSSTSPHARTHARLWVPPPGRRLRPGWPACAGSYQSDCEGVCAWSLPKRTSDSADQLSRLWPRAHARHAANVALAAGGERFVRGELCSEAVRLSRLLSRLMPDEAEVWGL